MDTAHGADVAYSPESVDGMLRACAHPDAFPRAPPTEEHDEPSEEERPRPSAKEEEPEKHAEDAMDEGQEAHVCVCLRGGGCWGYCIRLRRTMSRNADLRLSGARMTRIRVAVDGLSTAFVAS